MVDKIFIQFPEFQVVEKYNISKAWDSFYELDENKDIVEEIDKNLMTAYLDYIERHPEDRELSVGEYVKEVFQPNGGRKYQLSETAKSKFQIWFKNHRHEFITGRTYEKVRYDNELSYADNSRAARNNELIDIATSILSNKAQSVHFSNPGSFNKIKRIARVSEIVENPEYLQQYMEINNLNTKNVKQHIMEAPLEDLDKFLKDYAVERDVLSPQTFIYNHQQNMTGAKLIGMYANNNSMQAKFQGTGLSLKEEFSFEVNGRTIRALDRMKTDPVGSDQVTELISKNCAEWLAASVDNVKDPVLAKLLQNPNTANVAGFLLRAGLTIDEVGLFFRHPAVKGVIIDSAKQELDRGNIHAIIDDLLKMYGKAINTEEVYSLDSDNILDWMMVSPNRVTSLFMQPTNEDISNTLSEDDKRLVQEIYNMLALLENKILPAAEALSEMTRCCRADSPNGAIARTLPMALNQKIRLNNFWAKSDKINFPLENLGAMPNPDILKDNGLTANSSLDSIRRVLYQSEDGLMLQAFTTLGITAPIEIMSRWFKPFQNDILDMVSDVVRNHDNKYGTVNDDTMNTIFSDLTAFVLSKTEFFGDDGSSTFEEKRDWYLYEFPKQFLEIASAQGENYDAIRSLEIMKKLRVVNGEIVLRTGGALASTTKQTLKQSLDTLLYMDNPVAEQLATDLFAYAYYSKGFKFDAFDYAQFFSTTFLTTVGAPVIEALRSYDVTPSDLENFKEQLYMNRLSDIAPYVSLKKLLPADSIKGEKSKRVKLPLGLVYNDHMEGNVSNDVEKPAVFPKLNTDLGYYVLDTTKGDEDGISLADKVVYYKKVNRFRPETLGKTNTRQWSMYDASQSAEQIADKYVATKQQRNARLGELKKINGSFRKKASGKSKIKAGKIGKAGEGNYVNTSSNLSKAERAAVSTISYTQVNMANEEDITSVSGMSDSEAAAAVELAQTFDASEASDDVADITGFSEEGSSSAYIQAASTMDITQAEPSELADSGAVGLASKTDISKEDFEPTGDDFNNRCPQ